jgi:peptidoglycan/LPS O-acetylase OafA/YrhL
MSNSNMEGRASSSGSSFGRDAGGSPGVARGGAWIGGVILIALGFVFLAQNFGFPMPRNWWALFILIPAFGAFAGAWSIYQRNGGQMTRAVIGAVVSGLILASISVVFLLGYDFGKFWPVILILVGIGVLTGSSGKKRDR